MKKIFRKAITVLGSAALIGATVGAAAAAAYPAPFTSNTAIVVGANAAPSDNIAAASIASDLNANAASGTVTVTGGDSYKIEKTSTKFHLGDYIGNITSSNLDEDELPTLLAKGKYVDDDNDEFDYTQKIKLNNDTIQLKMFSDSSYAKDEPTLGFRLQNEDFIMNYTLDMTDKPYFNDLATTELPLMGKNYYVLSVGSSNDTITLLDSASSVILAEGDSTTMTAGGKSYTVSIAFISSSEVKLIVNGETTNSIQEAQTFKLSDGAYVGIKDIMYSSKDTGISQVEFSIGSGKLYIQDAQRVEMNDEDVRNVYGYIVNSSTQLDDIVLKWTANDETFITADDEIVMPGFNAVKLSFGGLEFPVEETFSVEAGGNDYIELSGFPLSGGAIDIAILGKASGNTNWTYFGSDTDQLLVTSSTGTITIDGSSDTNDEMFVVTFDDGTDAESYLVRVTGFNDPTSGDDTVDIEFNDGSGWEKKYDDAEQSDEISIGNAELTVTTLTSTVGSESVTFTAGSNVEFDELYTAEGLKVQLPVSDGAGTQAGYINLTGGNQTNSYQLVFTEENKDGDKSAGASFNITLGNNGANNYYASVTDVNNETSTREKDDTDVYESWMYGALATKFVEDDSGDQDYITITYHGDEVMAAVYVTSVDAVISGDAGIMTVMDSAVSTVAGKNLIVVGGSAINSVAAELLGSAYSEGTFTSATGVGAGEFLIQSFARSGKTALLVAGYNAADTEKAVTYLINEKPDTAVGTKLKGMSATEATVVTA